MILLIDNYDSFSFNLVQVIGELVEGREELKVIRNDEMTVEEQASQLRYDAPAVKRLGIPAYNWWNEGLHGLARSGIATMFPQAIGLAAMFDTELTQKVAKITAEEARAKYNAYTKYGDRDINKKLHAKNVALRSSRLTFDFPEGSLLRYLNGTVIGD